MTTLLLLAALAASPATNGAGAANADDQKIVCKSERVVGSNMARRTCKTKEKWAEDRVNGREGVLDAQDRERGFLTKCNQGGSLVGGNCSSGMN